MNKTRKWYTRVAASLLVTPMLIMSVAGIRHAVAAPAEQPAGPQTFNALIGHEFFTVEGEKSTWQADRFYPENITVNAGDSIMWKHDGGVDPHTVTLLGPDGKFPDVFVPPTGPGPDGGPPNIEILPTAAFATGGNTYEGNYLNSGLMASDIPGPREIKVTFPKPGTYKFVCLIHAFPLPDGTIVGMQGVLTVQAAGSPLAKSPAQVEAEAAAMIAADEAAVMAAEPDARDEAVTSMPGPDGTTIYHVDAGYQINAGELGAVIEYQRFNPEDINISVGDTIEWSAATPHSFHNVLFGDEPEVIIIEPQPAGPPKVYQNGLTVFPIGPDVHSGTGLYSSGQLVGPEDQIPMTVSSYSLTFSQPGRFEYICAYHYSNGMDGSVVVAARTGGEPGMPTTGNGDNTLPLLALVTGLLLASAGVGLRLRKVTR